MAQRKYAIYKMFDFETFSDDSPRGAYGPIVSILIKLTHDGAMHIGKIFLEDRDIMCS